MNKFLTCGLAVGLLCLLSQAPVKAADVFEFDVPHNNLATVGSFHVQLVAHDAARTIWTYTVKGNNDGPDAVATAAASAWDFNVSLWGALPATDPGNEIHITSAGGITTNPGGWTDHTVASDGYSAEAANHTVGPFLKLDGTNTLEGGFTSGTVDGNGHVGAKFVTLSLNGPSTRQWFLPTAVLSPVPEPGSATLAMGGLAPLGLVLLLKRRRRSAEAEAENID